MLSPGVETWSKSLLKVGFARKARVPLGLQDQTPQSLASGPDAMGLGVWPRARRQGLRRLAPWPPQNSFCTDLKPRGLYPLAEPYHPIYQSLPPNHSGAPRHVRDLIRDSEQHSVTNIHNSYNTISSTNVKHVDPTGSRTM